MTSSNKNKTGYKRRGIGEALGKSVWIGILVMVSLVTFSVLEQQQMISVERNVVCDSVLDLSLKVH